MIAKLFNGLKLPVILIGGILFIVAVGCNKNDEGWNASLYKENFQRYFDNPNPKTGQPYTDMERAALTYNPGEQESFLPTTPVILSLVVSKDISKISVVDGSDLAELATIAQATKQGDKYIATFQTTTDALKIQPGTSKILKFDIVYKDGSIGSIQFKVVVKKPLPPIAEILAGHWKFDDPADLTKATLGNNLVLAGTLQQSSVPGPASGNLAVRKELSSFYELNHGLAAIEGSKVNVYTLLVDLMKPSNSTEWASLLQTNPANSSDATIFINPSGGIWSNGIGSRAAGTVKPDVWHRVLITVGKGDYRTYVDGKLIAGSAPSVDGAFALALNKVLLFADNDGEDDALVISELMLFKNTFTDDQASDLPGVGKPLQ